MLRSESLRERGESWVGGSAEQIGELRDERDEGALGGSAEQIGDEGVGR